MKCFGVNKSESFRYFILCLRDEIDPKRLSIFEFLVSCERKKEKKCVNLVSEEAKKSS